MHKQKTHCASLLSEEDYNLWMVYLWPVFVWFHYLDKTSIQKLSRIYGNHACRGGRKETNRALCDRDGSASDQDAVVKVRPYYHVHRGSNYDALE